MKKIKKKKKKGKKKEEKEEKIENGRVLKQNKNPETKLLPSNEIIIDLNPSLNNSENIFFNGNEFTLANIIPKKSTLELLMEICYEMDELSAHLEKVLPSPLKYNINYKIINPFIPAMPIIPITPVTQNYSLSHFDIYDDQDYEIKNVINKANEITNNSIINKKNNNVIYNKDFSLDNEVGSNYKNNKENENMSNGRRRFPYDPYKHLQYYNDLRKNNNENLGNKNHNSD